MKFGVLGTGVVGQTIASKLLGLGHDVRLGSRAASETAVTFNDAAEFGHVVFNCLPGAVAMSVLETLPDVVGDKVLVDVSNPLDFSQGFPPSLSVVNTDSLAETIQRALPRAKVVKALNTVNADIMVNPALLPAPTDLFIAGNDEQAKVVVRSLLVTFGWAEANIRDLGGISAARAAEMYLPLWLNLMGATGTAAFNIHVVTQDAPPTG